MHILVGHALMLVVLAAVVLAEPATAARKNCFTEVNDFSEVTGVVCDGEASAGTDPRDRPATPVSTGPAAPPTDSRDVGIRAEYGRTPDGQQCIRLVDFVGPNEANSSLTAQAEQLYLRSLANTMACPGPDGLPAIASTPTIEAARFWQQMDLPALVPRIEPGKALVGLRAYLETGGQPSATDGGDTPFGPLTIKATRTVTVDWDDGPGSTTGPHAGSGGPHPDGDITWLYGRSGPRDIAVTQTWTATWSIGGVGDTFSGRGTTSTLFGFPVEEVQAVRDR